MACNKDDSPLDPGKGLNRVCSYTTLSLFVCLFFVVVVFLIPLHKGLLCYRGGASVQCHSRPPPIVDGPAASLVYETVEYVFRSRDNVTHFHCESFKQNYDTMMMLA